MLVSFVTGLLMIISKPWAEIASVARKYWNKVRKRAESFIFEYVEEDEKDKPVKKIRI